MTVSPGWPSMSLMTRSCPAFAVGRVFGSLQRSCSATESIVAPGVFVIGTSTKPSSTPVRFDTPSRTVKLWPVPTVKSWLKMAMQGCPGPLFGVSAANRPPAILPLTRISSASSFMDNGPAPRITPSSRRLITVGGSLMFGMTAVTGAPVSWGGRACAAGARIVSNPPMHVLNSVLARASERTNMAYLPVLLIRLFGLGSRCQAADRGSAVCTSPVP